MGVSSKPFQPGGSLRITVSRQHNRLMSTNCAKCAKNKKNNWLARAVLFKISIFCRLSRGRILQSSVVFSWFCFGRRKQIKCCKIMHFLQISSHVYHFAIFDRIYTITRDDNKNGCYWSHAQLGHSRMIVSLHIRIIPTVPIGFGNVL